MPEFWTLLHDGTIARQEPDGMEITASMRRAIISDNSVEWYETCYCNPPFKHERATIYDRFFSNMEIERVDSATPLKGQRFWEHLQDQQEETASSSSKFSPTRLRII